MLPGPAEAVTGPPAPMVSLPVEASVISPVPVVVTAPLVVNAPVLFTVVVPLPAWLMPVIVSGLAPLLFVSATLPLVELVALKLVTVFA